MTETTKDIPSAPSWRDHHHLQPGGQKNSITTTMYAAMADALAAAEQDASVRVVVFQGRCGHLQRGNDIGDFCSSPCHAGFTRVPLLHRLSAFPKPVIALGVRPGRGHWYHHVVPFVIWCTGDNAAFSMPFVNLGQCPEAASSLPQCWATTAPPKRCCWASPSLPKLRWKWVWSTAVICHPPNANGVGASPGQEAGSQAPVFAGSRPSA